LKEIYKETHNGGEDDEEDVSSSWVTLRKREDTGIGKREDTGIWREKSKLHSLEKWL
jgi:hypothetical protein